MAKLNFLLLFFLFYISLHSQGVGLNPQNVQWQVFKTNQVNVIFDKQATEHARRAATIIAYLDENGRRSIGEKNKKFDLVLRHYSAIPNGYAALAPFRSEFYLTPPESPILGSLQWVDVLTIHEYRHALQFMNGRNGFSRLAYYVFGETGQFIANVVAVPIWFYEGDAVVYETALTNAGRGRSPNFTQGMRGLVHEDKRLSYAKFRNGSFKDFVPDHYRLGYTILSHVRNTRGNDITGEIYRGATSYRKIIYPFSREMRAQTGLGTQRMYREAWDTYSKQWKAQQDLIIENSSTRVSQEWKYLTSYRFPKVNSRGQLYAVKNSVKRIPEIVMIEDDGETHIVNIGASLENFYDVYNEDFVWAEFSNNGRRVNEEYSDIVLFKDYKKKRLTSGMRYFSPVFSADGESIYAVEVNSQGRSQLVKLSSKNGKKQGSHDFVEMSHIMRPTVISESEVVYIFQHNSKVRLEKIEWNTGKITALTDFTYHLLNTPHFHDGYVYFSAGYSGIEDIYRVPVDGSKKLEHVTSSKVAANSPFFGADGELYYAQLSTNGLYLSKVDISDLARSIKPVSVVEPLDMSWMDDVAETAEGGDILESLDVKDFESTPYKGLFRGLKFHSYVPSGGTSNIGLATTLNNVLDDKQLALAANYNFVTRDIISDVSYRIGRFYPVIDLGVSTRKVVDRTSEGIERFYEFAPGINLFVPYTKLKGIYTMRSSMGIDSRYRIQRNVTIDEISQDNRNYYSGEFSVTAGILRRQAVQNMRPRLGAELQAMYGLATLVEDYSQVEVLGRLYLPGLLPNHSTLISGAYRKAALERRAIFDDQFDYPRGLDQFVSLGTFEMQKLELEYAFPLLYPDMGIAGIIYFKRVKANLFWENARLDGITSGRSYRAVGFDVIFDNVYLNLLPASLGFSVGWGTFEDQSRLFVTPAVLLDF